MSAQQPLQDSTSELVIVEPTLKEIAVTINREHDLAVDAAYASLMHAVRAGELLLIVRDRTPRGQWEDWLNANCPEVLRVSKDYMRVAFYKASIPKEITSATGALIYLRGRPPRDRTGPLKHPPEVRDEALRLVADGRSTREVAGMLGIARSCIRRWVDFDQEKGDRGASHLGERAKRARYAREKLAREALRRQEREQKIKRALVKEGQAFNELYAQVTRLDGVFGQARQEAQTKERRLVVNQAHALRDKMMDLLTSALGV
jgi:predicted transcriptional regulator